MSSKKYPPDGHPIKVSPSDIVDAWRQVSSRIPARFAVGTAKHETDYTLNETDAGDQSDGTDSIGLFQISRAEALSAGHPLADLTSLSDACTVFAVLMHRNLDKILSLSGESPLNPDVWAYLAMSHNMGMGAVEKTIKQYGLDWGAYKARNPAVPLVAHGYGDDVVSGGPDWDPAWDELPPPDASVDATDPAKIGLALVIGVVAFWILGRMV